MYTLRLLGGVSLDGPSGPLSGRAVQPRQSALLAILGAARDKGCSRERVVGLLWPESDEAEARHILSNSVYELRRALGEDAVLVSGDNLRLNSDLVRTDVAAFGEAVGRGDLAAAVEAYGGPFLHGFYRRGAGEFERWVESERQRLAVQYAEALESLAENAEQAGDFPRAVGWWQQLAAYDRYNSRFALRLMRAMAAAGDPANALQHAHEHERFLQNELEIEPPEDVLALAERLRRERVPSNPTFEAEPIGVKKTTEGAKGAAALTSSAWKASRTSRIVLIVTAAAIAIAAAALALLPERGVRLDKGRVVVAVFENQTGNLSLEPAGLMAADWITDGLARTGLVAVVPSPDALAWSQELQMQAGELGESDRLQALAEATGAGTVVWGAYYLEGDSLRFQAQIIDAHRRRLLRALEPVSGPLASPSEAVERLRQRVMGALGTLFEPRLSAFATESAQPPTFEVYGEYAEGLRLMLRREYREAIRHFYRSSALDSVYLQPLVWAALAHYNLADYLRADSLTRVVNRSRARLLPSERDLLDLARGAATGDTYSGYRAARRGMDMAPGPLWGIMLGAAAVVTNRPQEALEALAYVDPDGPAISGWHVYWLWPTAAYHMLGEHRRELETAQLGRRQYPNRINTIIYELRALAALGRVEEVNDRLDESLAPRPDWVDTHSYVMQTAAIELQAHGHVNAARDVLDRAISYHRTRRPAEAESAVARYDFAQTLYLAGQWEEAQALFEEIDADLPCGVSIRARRPCMVNTKGYLGVIAARRGDTEKALRISKELENLERHPVSSLPVPIWQAHIAAVLGEKARAVNLLQEAVSNGLWHGPWLHADPDWEPLRDYPPFRELMRPKG